jgi:ribonuclease J
VKVCIHRGTQEIGGTCIEIESEGKRLVLDLGLPLNADRTNPTAMLPKVRGFHEPDDSLLGIIISHPHMDHFGLAKHIPKQVPIIMGESAHSILKAADNFTDYGMNIDNPLFMVNGKVLEIGPFKITPFLVDHSAYDAYSVLIEAGGKRLLYSGDFRGHGRKARLFQELVKNPPKSIDVLLMEGTTVGGRESDPFLTEDELVSRFVEVFKSTEGMCLVWCSGQNIDRIVTVYKACKKAKRQFIVDMYTAEILRATKNDKFPQGHWSDIKVFLPHSQKNTIKRDKLFDISSSYKADRIYPESLPGTAPHSVMIFRESMFNELKEAGCLDKASLTYSLWGGYLEREQLKPFLSKLEQNKISLNQIHTSGHASVQDLKAFAQAINAKKLVPIHSFETDRFPAHFDNVELKRDGVWWETD